MKHWCTPPSPNPSNPPSTARLAAAADPLPAPSAQVAVTGKGGGGGAGGVITFQKAQRMTWPELRAARQLAGAPTLIRKISSWWEANGQTSRSPPPLPQSLPPHLQLLFSVVLLFVLPPDSTASLGLGLKISPVHLGNLRQRGFSISPATRSISNPISFPPVGTEAGWDSCWLLSFGC